MSTTYTMDCPPIDACGPCGTLPAGFVRLRYFFGKRMGVADFLDEQRYHAGKQRFHNQRLHGAGVLCGLAVSMQPGTATILRVAKGAAIDACGREILVAYDQCIDLDAWFQRELSERQRTDSTWPEAALDADGNLPLAVVLRYRDSLASPEPAPRDTCSCDAAGCDFGRVREEFELELWSGKDPRLDAARATVPARAQLDKLLGSAVGGGVISQGLIEAATLSSGDAGSETALVLATFVAELDTQRVVDVHVLRGAATLLAQTALLQELLERQLSASLEASALVDGPELAALTLERDESLNVCWLTLELTAPVVAQTVTGSTFTLRSLTDAGWSTIDHSVEYVPPASDARAKIRLKVDNSGNVLTKDGLYRIALDPVVASKEPIVDASMRTLKPLHLSLHFGIDQPAADLVVVRAPYAR
jgi:hypothetical protein